MKRLLLDTHIFLWYISGDKCLPDDMLAHIRNPDNEVYFSVVSVWEAIIKYQLGKLPLPEPPDTYLPTQRERHKILSLELDEASISHLAKLQPIHRDPFDRMLVCQTNVHNLQIVTVDKMIPQYAVSILV